MAHLSQLSRSFGGMPKLAVPFALVTVDGVEGDWQKNRKYHGGRDRAICLYSVELYAWLNQTLGLKLSPGTIGENFTLEGMDLDSLHVGDRVKVGTCVIELTAIREPCRQLNRWHPRLLKIILGHSGWVAKVIEPGAVRGGDAASVLSPADSQQTHLNVSFGA